MIRRHFLRKIADELIRPHLRLRAALTNIPRNLKLRLQEICGMESEATLMVDANIVTGKKNEKPDSHVSNAIRALST